jgi:hypothetical protein
MSSEEFFILCVNSLIMRPERCMGTLVSQNQITLRDLYLCRDIQSLVPLGLISMVYQGLFTAIVKLMCSQAGLSLMSRFRICGAVPHVPQCFYGGLFNQGL